MNLTDCFGVVSRSSQVGSDPALICLEEILLTSEVVVAR